MDRERRAGESAGQRPGSRSAARHGDLDMATRRMLDTSFLGVVDRYNESLVAGAARAECACFLGSIACRRR